MKRNQLKVLLLIEWVDWWLIKEREQLLPSLKKFHFFKLRHKRLYVVGPAASLINSSINSFTSFINQTQSISSSLHWTAQPRKPKWNKLIRFVEWRCFRGERPPAYNPPNQKQKNFSSINQAKANHSLLWWLMKRKLIDEEEKKSLSPQQFHSIPQMPQELNWSCLGLPRSCWLLGAPLNQTNWIHELFHFICLHQTSFDFNKFHSPIHSSSIVWFHSFHCLRGKCFHSIIDQIFSFHSRFSQLFHSIHSLGGHCPSTKEIQSAHPFSKNGLQWISLLLNGLAR